MEHKDAVLCAHGHLALSLFERFVVNGVRTRLPWTLLPLWPSVLIRRACGGERASGRMNALAFPPLLQEEPPDFSSREKWYLIPVAPGKAFLAVDTARPTPPTFDGSETDEERKQKRKKYQDDLLKYHEPATYEAQYKFTKKVRAFCDVSCGGGRYPPSH